MEGMIPKFPKCWQLGALVNSAGSERRTHESTEAKAMGPAGAPTID